MSQFYDPGDIFSTGLVFRMHICCHTKLRQQMSIQVFPLAHIQTSACGDFQIKRIETHSLAYTLHLTVLAYIRAYTHTHTHTHTHARTLHIRTHAHLHTGQR